MIVNAENYNIKGIVKDAKTGKTLPGATVRIHGTTLGCASRSNGEFVLKNVPEGDYIVKASFSGYKAQRMNINLHANKEGVVLKLVASPINLDEVTITGTGTHHKLKNTPVQTEVITRKTIDNVGSTNVIDLLSTVSPSFDFSPDLMGSYMSINGLSNKYILVLIDGVRLIGDISGNVDLTRINMGNIEKIEVVKGASSSLYGSDAIGGVINIITKKSTHKVNVLTDSKFGDNGVFSQHIGINARAGKLTSSTNLDYRKSNGYELKDSRGENEITYIRKFYTQTLSQKFTYDFSNSFKAYVGGSKYHKKIFNPRIAKKYYDYQFNDFSFNAGVKYLINKKSSIKLDVNNDNYKYDYLYFVDKKPYKVNDEVLSKRQRSFNANLKGIFKLNKQHTLIAGAEYLSDNLQTAAKKIPDGEKDAYTQSLYIQDEFKVFENTTIVGGLRFVDHKMFGNKLTPKVSVLQKIKDFNIRASYSEGFKTPSLQELFYEYEFSSRRSGTSLYLGNPELKAEESKYYSFSVEYVKEWFNASVSVYRNNIDNMINKKDIDKSADLPAKYQSVYPDPFDKRIVLYSNLEKARTQGIDFIFNTHLGHGLTLGGGYSYVDAADKSGEEDVRIEKIARNYANVRLAWDKNWNNYALNLTLTGRFQDGKYYDEGETQNYNLWRLASTHRFITKKNFNIDFLAGIDNIFNHKDTRPIDGNKYGTITPGRTAFFGIKINFTK